MNKYKYRKRYQIKTCYPNYVSTDYGLFLYFPMYNMSDYNRKYNKIICNCTYEYIKFKDKNADYHIKYLIKNI